MQMANNGYEAGWGLGRHVLGSNYFHYVRDPWGSYSEYSCDMDYIPAAQPWTPAITMPRMPSMSGAEAAADWTHNHEADQL